MSYAIQNIDGKHLGFLLFADTDNHEQGNCIFRSLPNEPEQFNSIESELLFTLQNIGEFCYTKESDTINIKHSNYSESICLTDNLLKIGSHKFKAVKLGNA